MLQTIVIFKTNQNKYHISDRTWSVQVEPSLRQYFNIIQSVVFIAIKKIQFSKFNIHETR